MAFKLENLDTLVLHRRAYRETSYLVDFFTLQQGKVTAVCKGVRGSKNDKKSLLQPFQLLLVSFYGRQELKNLASVESQNRLKPLDGGALFAAMYLNEVLSRCLPVEVPMPELYRHYLLSLTKLAGGAPLESILREFEIILLDELGYGLDWQNDCETGQPIENEKNYLYINQQGFRHARQSDIGPQHISGKILNDIANRSWDRQSLKYAKWIMRQAFLPVLGEKPLKSRELFLQREQPK